MRPSRCTRAICWLRVYDDWIIAERERLRAQFLTALEKLLLRARSRREFAAAADCARRILENDPWREDILRQLMSIRYESGDRTGALHEFEGFAERLQARTGCRADGRNDRAARYRAPRRHAAGTPGHGRLRTCGRGESGASTSVRRARSRTRALARRVDTRGGGHGSFFLIGGEAGIGKSRLAAELALLAAAQGGRVLRGSTSPDEPDTLPGDQRGSPRRRADVCFTRHQSGLVVGNERARSRGCDALQVCRRHHRSIRNDEQQRLFEALAQTFDALAKQRPLLVVLEDLHWAGASSLAAIEYLARQAEPRNRFWS